MDGADLGGGLLGAVRVVDHVVGSAAFSTSGIWLAMRRSASARSSRSRRISRSRCTAGVAYTTTRRSTLGGAAHLDQERGVLDDDPVEAAGGQLVERAWRRAPGSPGA